jgi:hypothetical protein
VKIVVDGDSGDTRAVLLEVVGTIGGHVEQGPVDAGAGNEDIVVAGPIGQTVVYNAIVSVIRTVDWAGQSFKVSGHFVTV